MACIKDRRNYCQTSSAKLLHFCNNRVGHFAGADGGRVVSVRLHVVGDVLTFEDDGRDGRFELLSRIELFQVAQHQHARQDQRTRVDLVQALVLRRTPVGRFEDGSVRADIQAGRDAQAADEACGQVAQDVTVQVREHDHVVQFRLLRQLHAHVVDDPLFELDLGIFLRDFHRRVKVQPVGVLHDVGLMHGRHLLAVVLFRVLERTANDPFAAGNADRLDRDAGLFAARLDLFVRRNLVDIIEQFGGGGQALLEFDTGVKVFGVLANDDQIDGDLAEVAADAGVVLAGADAGEQAELLSQVDVDAAETGPDRRRDRGLERALRALDAFHNGVGQRRAGRLHDVDARLLDIPIDLDACSVDASSCGIRQFGSNSVAIDQCYFVSHRVLPFGNMRPLTRNCSRDVLETSLAA